MPRKKIDNVEEAEVVNPVSVEAVLEDVKSSSISKIEISFGNGDLNLLRDKINEIIDHICQ